MWVYQETPETAAAKTLPEAIMPTAQEEQLKQKNGGILPETSQEERQSIPAMFSERYGNTPEKAAARRRKPSRETILLAAAYLLGTFLAGVAAARCVAGDAETLSYYLNCWQSLFSVQDAAGAVRLFRTEFLTVAGALTAVLFRPRAAAHLPFYDAVWDRLRIAFVQAACGFEPTDSICASLCLRYPCIPCGRNAVHVRRIRTAGKRKALFSRLRARRTGPQHRRAFGSVCPDAVSAPATLRCGSGDAISGRAGKTYLS